MKKFIILLMSVVLLFSVFAMSACDSGDTGEVTSSSETSSEEESSSSGKVSRNFGGGSSSIDTESNGNGNGLPITSTEPGGNGSTSVPEVSFSGDSFYAPETPVPSGTSANASMLIMQIGFIEVTPSNYKTVEATIKDAEDFYNTLTPSEKAEVINYQHLVAAREALNKIKAAGVWAEFEQGVNALPAPDALKNANVETVYLLRDLMNENRSSLSQNAGFSALETTLNACYQKIQSSLIETTFIAQDFNGDGILQASVVVGSKTLNEHTGDSGKRSASVSFFSGLGSFSSGSADARVMYTDAKNQTAIGLRQYSSFTNLSFTASCAGTITFYARPQNDRTYIFSYNGEQVDTFTSGDTSDSCIREVKIAGSGSVSITTKSSSGYCAAIKFSYPNLG